VSIQDN